MALIQVTLPAMGEGIFEATITQWLVNVGDSVSEDDSLVEVATDKVDSEIPAPVSGTIHEIKVPAGQIAQVGEHIATIKIQGKEHEEVAKNTIELGTTIPHESTLSNTNTTNFQTDLHKPPIPPKLSNGVFLSPLVRRIAEKENITLSQLSNISGSGINGRITKDDLLTWIKSSKAQTPVLSSNSLHIESPLVEVVEMSRMRKIIASNMLASKQTAPHVTTFHEVDVTTVVNWREKNKEQFLQKYNQKLTFTPVFVEAIAKALSDYPGINVSISENKILYKKEINIGMATALPDGNLIVPVIKQANTLNLTALATQINDLANRARNKALKPNETVGGTFTITNVGSFGNLTGTPIINQPESAILAIGSIKKRPAVIETNQGDLIGIRHQLILALSYDHRVIDGALGGMFVKHIADLLERFDPQRPI